jgi:hypothetical protein
MTPSDVTEDVTGLCAEFQVEVIQFSLSDFPESYSKYHPSSLRWMLIHKFFSTRGRTQDHYLLLDVRDTVFQTSPDSMFVRRQGNYLLAFLESTGRNIRDCSWNSGWIKDCAGVDVLKQVEDFTISCSGTVAGTFGAVKEYVEIMSDLIGGNPCERNGIDQGIHNVIIRTKKLKHEVILIDNESGPICTVQAMKVLYRDHLGRIKNNAGHVVVLVHQYDRSKALELQLRLEYPVFSSTGENIR